MTLGFFDKDELGCGCQVISRPKELFFRDGTDAWCVLHKTWHDAEHHDFQGTHATCSFCRIEREWHGA